MSVKFKQGDSGGKVNILRGGSISHCEEKKVHTNMVTELELFESAVTHPRFGCCCPHKQT
jgi:hypothetical protein